MSELDVGLSEKEKASIKKWSLAKKQRYLNPILAGVKCDRNFKLVTAREAQQHLSDIVESFLGIGYSTIVEPRRLDKVIDIDCKDVPLIVCFELLNVATK